MIDIHTHVLPGIDDGSRDMEETRLMLRTALSGGTAVLVATPHCGIPGLYKNYASEKLLELWNRVCEAAASAAPGLKICAGMEIYAGEDTPERLENGSVWTLNGTKYFLVEFSFREDPAAADRILARCAEKGFKPVIAHPERYYFLQDDPSAAYRWCRAGYALQLNKGSLVGRFGPREEETAHLLLSHGLAACVASDAHRADRRTTDLQESREMLTEVYGKEYAELLLEVNPRRILTGEDLLGYEPIPF